jgi:hypothetical protein
VGLLLVSSYDYIPKVACISILYYDMGTKLLPQCHRSETT